jgi:WD40 repeat protein/serine/threonine protein kinase
MNPQGTCPETARLPELLKGSLPETEQARLADHVETCACCQRQLDELTAAAALSPEAARRLARERAAPESALRRALDELREDSGKEAIPTRPPEGEGPTLDFLAPPRKEGEIGWLGPYEVLEVLGQGGMGVVLKAFDEKLRRVVAIKVMTPQLAASATARVRFTREARAAAAVRNEHVIDIHAVEEANGLPYLVMEYVAGVSLQERLDRTGPLGLTEVLRIGAQVAAGLAAAHTQGLIHRDVKPANILLENGVERVKLTDFGLARAADDASLTQSGVVAGTPQYMAPEQARGEAVDPRADLFSLGSVLYALCTGRAPFRASGALAVLKRVCEDTPRPIREINPEVPDWLVAIVARLQAKDPAERFPSAAEVSALLSQHLVQLQQHALALPPPKTGRGAGPARKPWLPSRRRWVLAAAALLLLAGGMGVSEATGVTRVAATVIRILTPEGTLLVETDDPAVKVTVEGDGGIAITGAGPQEVRLRPGSYRFRATKDGVPIKDDIVTITRNQKEVVRVSVEGSPHKAAPPGPLDRLDPAAIPAAERFDWQPKELVAVLGKHRQRQWGPVNSVAWSADGKRIASGGGDQVVRVWEAETMRERAVLRGHTSGVQSVVFSGDGRRILSGSGDATMRLWDAETGMELRRFDVPSGVNGVALSPDGLRALSAGGDQLVRLWNVQTGEELGHLSEHTAVVRSVAFSPDGRRALSGGGDGTVRLWDLEGRKQLHCLEGHTGQVYAVAFSPDGRRALSCNAHRYYPKEQADGPAADYQLRLWDLEEGKELRRFEGHTGPVRSVGFSADGARAISCGQDATVRLWEVDTGKEVRHFEGHLWPVYGAAFSPDGRRAVSGGSDGTVRLWDVETGQELRPLTGPTCQTRQAAFLPDGRHLLTAGLDRIVRLWDVAEGREARRFEGHTDPVIGLALSADGRLALSGSCQDEFYMPQPPDGDRAGPWRLWDVQTGKQLRRFSGPSTPSTPWVACVALSPDGQRAVTSCGSRLLLWDVGSGRELRALEEGTRATVEAMALLPDGRRALCISNSGAVCLWDLDTGKELRGFKGHPGGITALAIAPDGRSAVSTCGYDAPLRLWDLTGDDSAARLFLKWHTAEVLAVAFAPDGRTLASAGGDGRVILWDPAAGDKLREWQLPGPVWGVTFARDGRHLASANGNGTVYILRLAKP